MHTHTQTHTYANDFVCFLRVYVLACLWLCVSVSVCVGVSMCGRVCVCVGVGGWVVGYVFVLGKGRLGRFGGA